MPAWAWLLYCAGMAVFGLLIADKSGDQGQFWMQLLKERKVPGQLLTVGGVEVFVRDPRIDHRLYVVQTVPSTMMDAIILSGLAALLLMELAALPSATTRLDNCLRALATFIKATTLTEFTKVVFFGTC